MSAPGAYPTTDAASKCRLTASEVLDAAADLITPEGCWTQRVSARTADGFGTIDVRKGVCWCAAGAIRKVNDGPCAEAFEFVYRTIPGLGAIAHWNDHPDRTQAEVVAALRKAAELARSEGK